MEGTEEDLGLDLSQLVGIQSTENSLQMSPVLTNLQIAQMNIICIECTDYPPPHTPSV